MATYPCNNTYPYTIFDIISSNAARRVQQLYQTNHLQMGRKHNKPIRKDSMEHSLQTHPFIQITLNRNGKPKYLCPICNVKGYACTMINHLNGKKHAKRLWKSSHFRTNKRKFHQRYTTFIRQKQFKKRKLNETKKNRIRKRLIQEQTERVNAKKQIKRIAFAKGLSKRKQKE